MSDLASGRYPDTSEDWLLDGSPLPPYRQTISRRAINSGSTGVKLTATVTATTVLAVYPVVVQPGDIFSFITVLVDAIPTGTIAHSWAALYNGVATGSALLAQSADATGGFTIGALKLALGSTVANIGTVGTPQGGGTAAIVPGGPTVWGVALYSPGATTGALLDGQVGGSVAGLVGLTGQVPMVSTGTITAGATAPSVLPTMTAAATGVPYVLLSR